MINELFERELQNTSINNISLADYIKENYVPKKSGKWIIDRSVLPYTYTCNICGRNVFDDYDYCPFCGCRMFEPQEESEEQT